MRRYSGNKLFFWIFWMFLHHPSKFGKFSLKICGEIIFQSWLLLTQFFNFCIVQCALWWIWRDEKSREDIASPAAEQGRRFLQLQLHLRRSSSCQERWKCSCCRLQFKQLLQTAVPAAAADCSSSCFSVSRQLGSAAQTASQAAAATAGPAAWKCSKLQLQLSLTLCSFFEAEAAGRLQRGKCNSPWVQLAAQLTWTNPNRTRDQLMTWTNCNLTRNQLLMWTNYNHFRSLARFIL